MLKPDFFIFNFLQEGANFDKIKTRKGIFSNSSKQITDNLLAKHLSRTISAKMLTNKQPSNENTETAMWPVTSLERTIIVRAPD